MTNLEKTRDASCKTHKDTKTTMDNHLKGLKDEKKLFEDVYKKYQTLEGEIDAKLRKRVN